jgi:hypothetical protein
MEDVDGFALITQYRPTFLFYFYKSIFIMLRYLSTLHIQMVALVCLLLFYIPHPGLFLLGHWQFIVELGFGWGAKVGCLHYNCTRQGSKHYIHFLSSMISAVIFPKI